MVVFGIAVVFGAADVFGVVVVVVVVVAVVVVVRLLGFLVVVVVLDGIGDGDVNVVSENDEIPLKIKPHRISEVDQFYFSRNFICWPHIGHIILHF